MVGPLGSTPEPVTILGVDPGYERCGLALVRRTPGVREELLFSECFKTPVGEDFVSRLHRIGVEFVRLIEEHTPTVCAIERLYFTTNQKTAMHVAEVRGMLLYLATEHRVRVYEYGPNEIKVAISGDGRASKEQMMRMVPQLISIHKDITSDDEFDAIAVALTAHAILRTTPNQ